MRIHSAALAAAMLCCALLPAAQATETVRIATMDMTSGGLAGFGQSALKHWQFLADKASREQWAGDVRFEIVPFDTKMSPQEALSLLRQVDAQNIRFIAQGASSSSVGLALQEAIQKHNTRNPGREFVYLNYASAAPAMTGEKCSYWHFRTDAHVDMKIKAMMRHLAADPAIQRVYLFNPNYAYGQESARAARQFLAELRPDIEIVGDDYHPTGQVKDFAPYITKIMQSRADALVTVSFGNDLALMVKAANDLGMNRTAILTLSGNSPGMADSFGEQAVGKVMLSGVTNVNDDQHGATVLASEYKARMGEDFFFGAAASAMRLLAEGIKAAGSTAPGAVAGAMEGMDIDTPGGRAVMRTEDHQLLMPIYIDAWSQVDGTAVRLDQDGSGFGWRTVAVIARDDVAPPTSCAMQRPTS
ncbi:branched-chain amino acid ABC transporter substrate-binding protein [Corticibacter populi]|uniref:Branched-chain amino acid ABC transporter substrate-binding protein n=1 Tax=Corticibacter populi TaxID=1550736 RepID=A0A3M6QT73_9BURK|nr:ABC transporter substrate-binding protein [Corticibacter populi]RMX05759.1 branched-chain amino acid ABC transporter substrate-binding protein [Corticibacter populi]RZS30940.1 amino acid/amide ABC transporter substrate-binding protein (HAAT family) [Corticibacter populi]